MKQLSRLAIAGMAVALTHSAVAADDAETLFGGTFGANVKFATDYVFRGESETNDGQIPAVQGSITWSHPSGFYAGFFGSTNKFASAPDISAVVGPYIGKTGTIGSTDIGYNVMIFDYEYPGANKYNYTELYMYAWKQFGDFNLKFEVTPTLNDWFGVEGWKGINYAVHPKMALPYGVTLDGSTSAVDLSADRTIGLGGTADMTLSTGALSWTGAAGKTGSLIAGTTAALTLGANAVAVASVDSGGLGLVLAANKNLSGAAGTGSVSLGSMSGTLTTPTGLNTVSGDLLMASGKVVGFGAPQALSGAGACNVTTVATLFTSTGAAQALTLADGTRAGQLKFVSHVVDGGSGVLTPTTKTGFTTVTLTAVNDWVCLIWSGAAWFVLAYSGATIA